MNDTTDDARGGEPAIGEILLQYWFLPVLLGALFAGAGLVAGLSRSPEFSSSATLSVGTTNVNTPNALGGFASSAPALAGAYSRAITAREVIDPVGRALNLAPDTVRARVIASQVPDTPIIRVDATAPSGSLAIDLANLSAARLQQYAGDQTASAESGKAILRRYRIAQEKLLSIRQQDGVSPADIASAKLEAESLAHAYQQSQEGLGASNPLSVLAQAATASSDRVSKLKLFTLLGLLAGIVLGSALALVLDRRRLG